MKDNVGFLASAVAWTLLTSLVPVIVGLLAITSFFLQSRGAQEAVVSHLRMALLNVFREQDLRAMVQVTTRHRGLLGIIGFFGILWGASNVGGAISTVFQPIFQVKGRDILKEKVIDVVMIFVFTVLMVIIVAATFAVALLNRLFSNFPLPGIAQFLLGTAISLLAAFLLFSVIYVVFPNTEPRFKLRNVWPGAAIAAVLFQALTYIWPIYAHFSRFKSYGALIGPILVLTAWIYFFSMVLLIGAEFVAFDALRESRAEHQPIGPAPDGTVPQREQEPSVAPSGS